MSRHEIQNFRHRGFQPNDGSPVYMVMGNDPDPLNADGTPMHKLWDQDISQVITVTPHVDVAPPAP